jgi:hypothetical protein
VAKGIPNGDTPPSIPVTAEPSVDWGGREGIDASTNPPMLPPRIRIAAAANATCRRRGVVVGLARRGVAGRF